MGQVAMVLSLFPGIDILGRGFESEGWCVVRGPDPLFGTYIEDWHAPSEAFDGIIGGPPCQDFSKLRRLEPTGQGVAMLREFGRVVLEAEPEWWLMENVPTVPDLVIDGYQVQRFDVRAWEFGGLQDRCRHFQFGSVTGRPLLVDRPVVTRPSDVGECVTSGTELAEACRLQGVPGLLLPAFTREAARQAVANGVCLPVAIGIARAIGRWCDGDPPAVVHACVCGCGRRLTGKAYTATPACRKRLQRTRSGDRPGGGAAVTVRDVT